MSIETMLILVLVIFVGYVIFTYKKLLREHALLEKLSSEIKVKNSDTLRRRYNAIARNYNNTLDSFIGKQLAKKLNYKKQEIIEKI